ncbi:MAG TPA: transporter substrate-binding domain-containing protein [Egicoccus sp.]|nr:transporter substrate-binding domain-containing protein [Egicoccus sp.]HSK24903.1 transporter substrate-binding domain-containing protein [Egicoccus sp.]
MTTRRAAAAFAALALTLTACGDDDGGTAEGELDLVADGTLTVCSDLPYEPFEFEDPDSDIGYSGFDIELVQAIAETADLDVAVIASGFEALTSGTSMATGDCDMAASAMTITEERAENIDFSEPYYDALQSLLVPADSDIAAIGDLGDGVTVGVQSGTTGEIYATENVEGAEIRAFENPGDLFVALDAGQIDAILQDLPVNAERARGDDNIAVVEEYDTDEQYGFAFEKDRPDELLQVINDGLAEVRDNGTYDELYDKYFSAE